MYYNNYEITNKKLNSSLIDNDQGSIHNLDITSVYFDHSNKLFLHS